MQQAKLVRQQRPVYPPRALDARIAGVVELSVVIAKDGTVRQVDYVAEHLSKQAFRIPNNGPVLAPAAIEAVRRWVYQPTLLNGDPVEVATTVNVNFRIGGQ